MKSEQKEAFVSYEADMWFERNLNHFEKYDYTDDRVIKLIQDYNLPAKRVLEIGCSAGYRLNALSKIKNNVEIFGVDVSKKAIDFGRNKFPKINFINSSIDDLQFSENKKFDIVIVGFVFYVLDRNILFKAISEIDRVLKNSGHLIIVDFFSINQSKNKYHHIKEFEAHSFKQKYSDLFTSSNLYHLVDQSTINHSNHSFDSSNEYFNKMNISLLKKDINSAYK